MSGEQSTADPEQQAAEQLIEAIVHFVRVHQTALALRIRSSSLQTPAPAAKPIAVGANEAAALIGVSRATFWKLHSAGKVPLPVRLTTRCPRWVVAELTAWMSAGCPSRTAWLAVKAGRP